MKALRGSSYSLMVVILGMLAVIGISLRLEYFASKLLPLLIGSIVLVLAVLDLARELTAGRRLEAAPVGGSRERGEAIGVEVRQYLRYAAWTVGFLLAIYFVGFMLAIPAFVGAYMKQHGSKWPGTLITAVAFTVVIYMVFNYALKANLYRGQLLILMGF